MFILHQSGGCLGCPFFHYTHVAVGTEPKTNYGRIPVCNLDGMTPVSYRRPLVVTIKDPEVSPDTCPLLGVHGTGVEVQRG